MGDRMWVEFCITSHSKPKVRLRMTGVGGIMITELLLHSPQHSILKSLEKKSHTNLRLEDSLLKIDLLTLLELAFQVRC